VGEIEIEIDNIRKREREKEREKTDIIYFQYIIYLTLYYIKGKRKKKRVSARTWLTAK
jgi:hypothetical protein